MADSLIRNLTEDTTPSLTDIVAETKDPAGTPVDRKVTLGSVLSMPHPTNTYIEGSAPSTPAAGQVVTYVKTDGNLYKKTDGGVEAMIATGMQAITSIPGGRLTTRSGDPENLDGGGSGLCYTPYLHDRVELYEGAWTEHQFSEISGYTLASGSVSDGNNIFDIFIWNDSGTLKLEGVAWKSTTWYTSASGDDVVLTVGSTDGAVIGEYVRIYDSSYLLETSGAKITAINPGVSITVDRLPRYVPDGKLYFGTRSTALLRLDGRLVKTGDTGKLYLGTIMGTASDTLSKRYVWNAYNQINKPMLMNVGYADNNAQETINVPTSAITALPALAVADGLYVNALNHGLMWVCGLKRKVTLNASFYGQSGSTSGSYMRVGVGHNIYSYSTDSGLGGGFEVAQIMSYGTSNYDAAQLQWQVDTYGCRGATMLAQAGISSGKINPDYLRAGSRHDPLATFMTADFWC